MGTFARRCASLARGEHELPDLQQRLAEPLREPLRRGVKRVLLHGLRDAAKPRPAGARIAGEVGDTVGVVELSRIQIPLIYGENIWDVFADFRDDEINESHLFHSWIHKPLVSGSIKYEGSYFHHTTKLYKMNTHYSHEEIKVINNSDKSNIRFWTSN